MFSNISDLMLHFTWPFAILCKSKIISFSTVHRMYQTNFFTQCLVCHLGLKSGFLEEGGQWRGFYLIFSFKCTSENVDLLNHSKKALLRHKHFIIIQV